MRGYIVTLQLTVSDQEPGSKEVFREGLLQPSPDAQPCWPPPTFSVLPAKGSVQFSSVAQSCPTLCDPMNRSTPGLPVHHQLPEFTQTHVHRVRDAIQPSHPGSSPSPPAPYPSQRQSLFQWVSSSQEAKESHPCCALSKFLIHQIHDEITLCH